MFAKARAAAASAAMAAKQAAEEADRRYGISDAVAGASVQAASVAERVDLDGKRALLTDGVARMTEQAVSVAERVDLDGKKALLTDGVAMVTTKASAFIEESLAEGCDLCYCTRRLVTMPMPGPPPNTIQRLARDLHAAHGTHFMVWNLSEVSYDYSTFHDQVSCAAVCLATLVFGLRASCCPHDRMDRQVLEFRFPGHPAPPLELLVRICNSVDNWLAADGEFACHMRQDACIAADSLCVAAENVAVVHCRTGKRRTCTVIACLMAWLGAASDPLQALQVVAQRRGIPISSLTIPSQRRYAQHHRLPTPFVSHIFESLTHLTASLSTCHSYIRYFDRVLHGDKPSLLAKRLQRIMVNTIPDLCAQSEEGSSHGCSVELQLLQNGRLLWCSTRQTGTPRHFLLSDGCMSFPADLELTADVVLRCSHIQAVDQQNLTTAASLNTPASAGGGAAEADGAGDQSATRSGDRDEHSASEAASSVGNVSKFDRVPMWRTAFNVGYVQAGLLVSVAIPTSTIC
jgi:hypothetical protein